jgi:hypothetical protein
VRRLSAGGWNQMNQAGFACRPSNDVSQNAPLIMEALRESVPGRTWASGTSLHCGATQTDNDCRLGPRRMRVSPAFGPTPSLFSVAFHDPFVQTRRRESR